MEEKKLRIRLMLILLLLSWNSFAKTFVFVSFSMPKQLLIETLQESSQLNVSAVLNGLCQNSMPETAKRVMALTEAVPNMQLLIDPTLFERFSIHQVPAIVVGKGHCFDVIYGNLTLREALTRIRDKGECARSAS
jgi:conjugal transfer pilus assembly protein TrbC